MNFIYLFCLWCILFIKGEDVLVNLFMAVVTLGYILLSLKCILF